MESSRNAHRGQLIFIATLNTGINVENFYVNKALNLLQDVGIYIKEMFYRRVILVCVCVCVGGGGGNSLYMT